MTAQAKFMVAFGGSAQNHILGSSTKDAGVTISAGGVVTCDTSQAHRWAPMAETASDTVGAPAGYTKLSVVCSFTLSRDSIAAGQTHTKIVTPLGTITEDTSQDWTFSNLAGAGVAGSFSYTPSGTHHIMIWVCKSGGGASWTTGDTVWVTILIDKVIVFSQAITPAVGFGGPAVPGSLLAGQSSPVTGATPTFTVANVAYYYSDRANPIGKVTVQPWGYTLGATPPTGWDKGNKSSGTDAAALIDERPPAGSGTTDADYFQCLFNSGVNDQQMCKLASNILGAGDIAYAVILKYWARAIGSAKLASFAPYMHDGTTAFNPPALGSVSITAPTSYAESQAGNNKPFMFNTAPDGTLWSGKTNTYLNLVSSGVKMNGVSANADMNFDALVTEAAIVLKSDTIAALPDPGAAPPPPPPDVPTQVLGGKGPVMRPDFDPLAELRPENQMIRDIRSTQESLRRTTRGKVPACS